MKNAVIVFSGFNERAVVAFLRTLKKNNITFAIIAKSKQDKILQTNYSSQVMAVRNNIELNSSDLVDAIKQVQKKLGAERYLIAPSTEALNRFLLARKKDFQDIGCEIPLVGESVYEQLSDKLSFTRLCEANNIQVPKEFKSLSNSSYPFVAKPKTYYTHARETHTPILIHNQDENHAFSKKYNANDFYYQEFIGGKSYYLLYYFYANGEFASFSQINYLQQPEGKSIIAAESSDFHTTEESKKYERLLKSIKFRGLVMVEVKCFNGQNYMIEANPRFWGPSQLFVDANVNLFEAFFCDWGLIKEAPVFPEIPKKTKYFWYGGIKSMGISPDEITYHSYDKEQFKKSFSEWMSKDVYNRDDTRQLYNLEIGSL